MDYRERISRSMRRNNRNRSTNKQHETIDFHDVDALYYRKWLWGIPKNLRKALRLNKTLLIDEKGNIMPIDEFNEAKGTHFTLEQIYGIDFWNYLETLREKVQADIDLTLQMDFKESKAIFAKNGISYHQALRKIFLLGNEDKGDLLNELGELRLDEDYHLGIRIASPEIDFTGDESNFFIYDCHNGKVTSEIFDHISVNPSPEAAWQVYLLMTSPTVMPVHWHGGYIVRKFIFDTSDLEEIEPIKDVDVSVLKENNMLLPDVTMRESKAGAVMADVYCCYWNEWKGLVREHAVVEMKDGRVVGFSVTGSICLYEYSCGRVY